MCYKVPGPQHAAIGIDTIKSMEGRRRIIIETVVQHRNLHPRAAKADVMEKFAIVQVNLIEGCCSIIVVVTQLPACPCTGLVSLCQIILEFGGRSVNPRSNR